MNKNVLIFGAGSIGNHMSYACSKLKYKVFLTDISKKALIRMKNEIYPKRYKKWNSEISLIDFKEWKNLKNNFDLIIIGTPPKTHLNLLKNVNKVFSCKKILVEKPLASYVEKLNFLKKINKKFIFCGYNHSVSPSINFLFEKISVNKLKIKFIDVQWREGWNGILGAHYWLKNQFSSYLGDYKSGGGAIQEHSHGLHLAICLVKNFFKNKTLLKNKTFIFNKKNKYKYDCFSKLFFSNNQQHLNLEIDLLSNVPKKEIHIFSNKFNISWIHNFKPGFDAVITYKNQNQKLKLFKKNRSTEFINEIKHIEKINSKTLFAKSRINVINAIDTMKIIKKFFNDK